jgi:hypothetical protein
VNLDKSESLIFYRTKEMHELLGLGFPFIWTIQRRDDLSHFINFIR